MREHFVTFISEGQGLGISTPTRHLDHPVSKENFDLDDRTQER